MPETTGNELTGNELPVQTQEPIYLFQISPADKKWDDRRADADGFRDLYKGTVFDRYASRIADCSGRLAFAWIIESSTNTPKLKLQAARFCRVSRCPVCQWRRSLMWRARAIKIIPKVIEENPTARFIFLTLTVRNCPLDELRATLKLMNNAWNKLCKRKEFPAVGWIKSIEVTRSRDDSVHPHFHCLLMVSSGYFGGRAYLSQQRWTDLWQSCLGVNYSPRVDVRAIKPSKEALKRCNDDLTAAMMSAVLETLKYSVKPEDVLRNRNDQKSSISDQDWLIELTSQLHKARLIATGGLLREYLKELEEDPEDLIHADEDGEHEPDNESPRLMFGWKERTKKYRMEDTDTDL